MGYEYLRLRNIDGYNYVEMLSIGYKKQMYIRNHPELNEDKIIERKPQGCDCTPIEYIDRDYFTKLENEYDGL